MTATKEIEVSRKVTPNGNLVLNGLWVAIRKEVASYGVARFVPTEIAWSLEDAKATAQKTNDSAPDWAKANPIVGYRQIKISTV